MEECIFCKIAKGETETTFEKATENLVVFKDINPAAAIHLLIVPRNHLKDITGVTDDIWKEIKDVALEIAREKGLRGFRLVHNAGEAAAINHMHVHLLGDVTPDRAV